MNHERISSHRCLVMLWYVTFYTENWWAHDLRKIYHIRLFTDNIVCTMYVFTIQNMRILWWWVLSLIIDQIISMIFLFCFHIDDEGIQNFHLTYSHRFTSSIVAIEESNKTNLEILTFKISHGVSIEQVAAITRCSCVVFFTFLCEYLSIKLNNIASINWVRCVE